MSDLYHAIYEQPLYTLQLQMLNNEATIMLGYSFWSLSTYCHNEAIVEIP